MSGSSAEDDGSGVFADLEDYEVSRSLGEGSFGQVRLGIHKKTGKKVAIKMISRGVIVNLAEIERASREFYILQTLEHPNIIYLHEVIVRQHGKRVFVVMEYADGGSLGDLLQKHGRMGEKRARRFFYQLVKAVRYCHRKHIVHRDLKPDNVLLSHGDHVKVADFGLSNTVGHTAAGGRPSSPVGTPLYSAPEVLFRSDFDETGRLKADVRRELAGTGDTGEAYRPHRHRGGDQGVGAGGHGAGADGKGRGSGTGRFEYDPNPTDMWSMGVILFEMVYGRLPFPAKNKKELRRRILGYTLVLPAKTPAGADGRGRRRGATSGTKASGTASGSERADEQDCIPMSRSLRALIRSMLEVEPRHRATIDQVHSHVWLSSGGRNSLPSMMLSPSAEEAASQAGFPAPHSSATRTGLVDGNSSMASAEEQKRPYRAGAAADSQTHASQGSVGIGVIVGSTGDSDGQQESARPRRSRAMSQLNDAALLRARRDPSGHSSEDFADRIYQQREHNLRLYEEADLGVDLDAGPSGLASSSLLSSSVRGHHGAGAMEGAPTDSRYAGLSRESHGDSLHLSGRSHMESHGVGKDLTETPAIAHEGAAGSSLVEARIGASPVLPSLPADADPVSRPSTAPNEGVAAGPVKLGKDGSVKDAVGVISAVRTASSGSATSAERHITPEGRSATFVPFGMSPMSTERASPGLPQGGGVKRHRSAGHVNQPEGVAARESWTQPPSPEPDQVPGLFMRPASADHALSHGAPPKAPNGTPGIGLRARERMAVPPLHRGDSHGSASRPSTASSQGSWNGAHAGGAAFALQAAKGPGEDFSVRGLKRTESSASMRSDSRPPTTPVLAGLSHGPQKSGVSFGRSAASSALSAAAPSRRSGGQAGRLGALRPAAVDVPVSPASGRGPPQRGAMTAMGRRTGGFGHLTPIERASQTPTVLRRARVGRQSAPDSFAAQAASGSSTQSFAGAAYAGGVTGYDSGFSLSFGARAQRGLGGGNRTAMFQTASRSSSTGRPAGRPRGALIGVGGRRDLLGTTRSSSGPTNPESSTPNASGQGAPDESTSRGSQRGARLREQARVRRPSLRAVLRPRTTDSGSQDFGYSVPPVSSKTGKHEPDGAAPSDAQSSSRSGRGPVGRLQQRPSGRPVAHSAPKTPAGSIASYLAALREKDAVATGTAPYPTPETASSHPKDSWSDRLYSRGVYHLRTKGKFFGVSRPRAASMDTGGHTAGSLAALTGGGSKAPQKLDAVDRLMADATKHQTDSRGTMPLSARAHRSPATVRLAQTDQQIGSQEYHTHYSRALAGAGASYLGLHSRPGQES